MNKYKRFWVPSFSAPTENDKKYCTLTLFGKMRLPGTYTYIMLIHIIPVVAFSPSSKFPYLDLPTFVREVFPLPSVVIGDRR